MSRTRHSAAGPLPLPAWKFEAPRLAPALVERPRLLSRLERCLGKERSTGDVFLVSAPAGFGKTTLLAQWAQATAMPVMWYHLDASDDDPAALIYGLVGALRTQLPRGHWQVKTLLASLNHGTLSPLDVRRACELLIGDIRSHVTKPMALILTGVAELSAKGAAHSVLEQLIARSPDHLRLALEFREVPPLRLAPLLPQRRLDGLGLEDLQLTEDELVELLATLEIDADDAYRQQLSELCGGWVTGVLLATGALWPECLAARASDQLNREAVFGYLASEVIDRLPETLSEFVARAALLESMTAPLCAELFDVPDAHDRLVALERRTGFVIHVGRRPQEPIYRFQPLLRHALLDRLEETLTAREIRALRLRAGELLEENAQYEEAIQQYAQGRAFERVITLIEAQRGWLLRAGRGATLARWLDLVPDALRDAHPHLCILLAELYRQSGRTGEALSIIERVCERLLPFAAQHSELVAQALIVRADLRYIRGQYEDARRDCEQALTLAPADADEVHIKARFLLAVSVNGLEGPDAARTSLDGLEERCARQGDLWARARLEYVRSNLSFAKGAFAQAEQEALAGLRYAEEAGDEVRAIACRLQLGAIRQNCGRSEEARQDFESAITQSQAAGHVQGQAYALANLADLEFTLGDYDRARCLFEEALALLAKVGDGHLRAYAEARLAYVLVQQGLTECADRRLRPCLEQYMSDTHALEQVVLEIALGFVRYHMNDYTGAASLLRSASCAAADLGADIEHARAQLVLAAVCAGCGDEAAAVASLREALDTMHRIGNSAAFQIEVRYLPGLVALLRHCNHPLMPELLADSRAASDQQGLSQESAHTTADVPLSVHIFAFGDARVVVHPHRVTRWRIPRARELLFFLADTHEPIRKDVILDAIWPDKDPKEAETAFRQARAQLKLIFGQTCIEQCDGRWRIALDYALDVHEFERLLDEAADRYAAGQIVGAVEALRQALALHTGSYLDDIYSDWAILRREALHNRYLDALERLGDLELRQRHLDAAASVYRELLAAEPYRECAHRGLMLCAAMRGEYAQALRQFNACVAALRDELGATPGPKTLALRQQIQAKMQSTTREYAAGRA